jgi:acid phosphatase
MRPVRSAWRSALVVLATIVAACTPAVRHAPPAVPAIPSLVEAKREVSASALSNVPALRADDWGFVIGGPCDLPRGPCGFVAWLELARAEPIDAVLTLARWAREHGVGVFFITGRPERFRAATERNLRAAGYEWTGLILKPDDLVAKSAVEFKAAERRALAEQGWVIAVNVGDQASDLDGGHAERTYRLPNPFYFVP